MQDIVTAELWRRGQLGWKRHSGQQQIRQALFESSEREHFALCSRRYGKSFEAVLSSFEFCIQNPNGRVVYLAPWAKDAALIAGDLAWQILDDCPEELRPEFRSADKEMHWANGSVMRFKGTNGEHARYLRGGKAHRVILDECGQMDDLEAVVKGVVIPMTAMTSQHEEQGRILHLSTPAPTPAHDSTKIYNKLHALGATSTFTLADAPHIPYEEKIRLLVDVGESPESARAALLTGARCLTDVARREFFCEFVVDKSRAVVPEWEDFDDEAVVLEYPRPSYFTGYGAADMGMKDRTGILCAFVDFKAQVLVVEGELLLDRANTPRVAAEWATKEADLGWRAWQRVCDDPSLRVSADLTALGLACRPVQKAGREAAVAAMRGLITAGRLKIIGPNCPALVHQLQTAIYKKSGDFFERDANGHFDLVDALIYLVRSIVWTHNPYPVGYVDDLQAEAGWQFRPSINQGLPNVSSKLNQAVLGSTPAGRKLLKRGAK